MSPDSVQVYDEFAAKEGSYGLLHGDQLMKTLFKK
jgi:2,3-bisphosphoglycerate-independent phosphoglycerate mutase